MDNHHRPIRHAARLEQPTHRTDATTSVGLVLRVLACVLVVAASLLLSQASGVDAQASLVVLSNDARVNFPAGLSFRLDAESGQSISDVQLQVNTPGQRYGGAVRNVRPAFTPGERVSAEWTWVRFGSGLPPGTEVTYRWRVTLADGSVTETPLASVRVQDSRYTWQELRDAEITVRWYRGDARFGRELLTAARESVNRLQRAQGVDLRFPLTVHVYGSQSELFQALPGVPGWVGGIAIPEFDTLMIGIEPSGLAWGRRAMTHEIAHQIVYQMTAHPTLGSRVPTWLNEGLAVVSEGETEAKNRGLVAEAVATDSLPTLRNLGAPFSMRGGHLAGVAYAASESAVRYLLDRYGAEAMRTLLLALGEGRSTDEATRRAYNLTLDQLEDGWRQSLNLRPYDRGTTPTPGGDGGPEQQLVPTSSRGDDADLLLWLLVGVAGAAAVAASVLAIWLVVRRARAV